MHISLSRYVTHVYAVCTIDFVLSCFLYEVRVIGPVLVTTLG